MHRQKIGQTLFWLGLIFIIIWQALTWIQSPIQRIHTAEELNRTIHAVWGPLFLIRIIGGSGMTLVLVGALVYSGDKGSYFWLFGFLPNLLNFGQYWEPTQHMPWLFGFGGTVILLSYIGILWLWMQSYHTYDGIIKTGKQIQLLGYSFILLTGLFLCMYFGNPKQLALADLPLPSGEIINITLSLGMLLLLLGHYLVTKNSIVKNGNP